MNKDYRSREFNATKVRAGRFGRPVLAILVISLILAFIAWIFAEIWGISTAPDQQIPSAETLEQPAQRDLNPGAAASHGFDNNPEQ